MKKRENSYEKQKKLEKNNEKEIKIFKNCPKIYNFRIFLRKELFLQVNLRDRLIIYLFQIFTVNIRM